VLSQRQFEALIQCDAAKRYRYALKRIADWEDIWSLYGADGWVASQQANGPEIVPIWPHPQYAAYCANAEWGDTEPRVIFLDDWQVKWLPGLSKDGRLIQVFPVPSVVGSNGPVVSPERMKQDLDAEPEWYE